MDIPTILLHCFCDISLHCVTIFCLIITTSQRVWLSTPYPLPSKSRLCCLEKTFELERPGKRGVWLL